MQLHENPIVINVRTYQSATNQESDDEELRGKIQTRSSLMKQATLRSTFSNNICCDKCRVNFDSPVSYYRHILTHRTIKSCFYCDQQFRDEDSQLSHETLVHKHIRWFACPHCFKKFAKQENLTSHLRKVHRDVKRLLCPICSKSFNRTHDLQRHLNIHLNIKLHACKYCDKQFSHQSNLIRHERTHTGQKPYGCTVCGKRFAQTFSLTAHTWKHVDKVSCSYCPSKFGSISGMIKHIKNIHHINMSNKDLLAVKSSQTKQQKCELEFVGTKEHARINYANQKCSPNIDQEKVVLGKIPSQVQHSEMMADSFSHITLVEDTCQTMGDHTLVLQIDEDDNSSSIELAFKREEFNLLRIPEDNLNDRQYDLSLDEDVALAVQLPEKYNVADKCKQKQCYTCNVCGKINNRKFNHELHMAVHDPSLRKYECTLCHLKFLTLNSLNRHLIKHTNIEVAPYQCDFCDKAYKTKDSLSYHVRKKHEKRVNHACNLCGKQFYDVTVYKYHMRLHNNECPYMCSSCGKKFAHSSHLHRHEKIHSGLKSHICSICSKSFIQASSLKRHLATHKPRF